jgi:predicted N-acetyltransferase YhbS
VHDDRPAPPDPATVHYRRARVEDAERTFEVVRESTNELLVRSGRTPSAGTGLPLARVLRFRHACVANDPDGFWVAEAAGQVVGAAIAVRREDVWYLAGLHVVPAWQSVGVGAELIRRALTGTTATTTLTVLTDALNPASNGLYLRFGMLPLDSTFTFDGPIGPALEPSSALRARPMAADDAGAIAALDRATVGFARPTDHVFWQGVPGLEGRLLLGDDGTPRGYLYVSEGGAIGPVAVHDPADLPAALDAAAAIARAAGATTLHLRAFGVTHGAIRWALHRGARLTGIGLFLGSRPVGTFAGYVTSGADALY